MMRTYAAFFIFSVFLVASQSIARCQTARTDQAQAKSEASATTRLEPSVDIMLGSMLMLGFRGMTPEEDQVFYRLMSEGKIGNVILFDKDVTANSERNISSPEQVRKLCASLRKLAHGPMFIGVDQEGGQVRRLKPQKGFMNLPSAQSMGQGNPQATLETASALGEELKGLGINLDLAPVADVDVNPLNPAIGKLGRAFNTVPQTVAEHALLFGHGLAKNGVTPTLKHFPGQGCANEDSHLGMTDISQCWKADTDLLPYAEIFKAGWPGMVMVGHMYLKPLDADLPATLSKKIVTGLLREGLGWQGVVISDDLQMKAVAQDRDLKEAMRLAIGAGIDILLLGNNLEWDPNLAEKAWNALRSLYDEGVITDERLRQSWQRISALHAAYAQ